MRKHKFAWRTDPRLTAETVGKFMNTAIKMDMRKFTEWDRSLIREKS